MTEKQKKDIKEAGSVSAYLAKLETENKKLKVECATYKGTINRMRNQIKQLYERFV